MDTLVSNTSLRHPGALGNQKQMDPESQSNGLQAIKYARGSLQVLDQLKLPHENVYDEVKTCEEAFDCIKAMRVRGAPAIAIVAALALAVEIYDKKDNATERNGVVAYINKRLDYLLGSRPTAVDLSNAIRILKQTCKVAATETLTNDEILVCADIRQKYMERAEKIFKDDYNTNKLIGNFGAEYLRRPDGSSLKSILEEAQSLTKSPATSNEHSDTESDFRKISVLTHCNTGSLATSGHGTALGIIRSLFELGYLEHAYCTETRPYNQGSRLTAFELQYEKIPSTLITDSMAGALFSRKKDEMNITAVIVGADRVARNGDTANKIGTYSLAVLAKYHGIKFIVAAPTTSIDLETEDGSKIKIEDRPHRELTQITGAIVDAQGNVDVNKSARVAIADQTIDVWNPSFDVTPHELIDAIVTEKGVVTKNKKGNFAFRSIMRTRWRELNLSDETNLSTFTDGSGNTLGTTALESPNMPFPMEEEFQ